MREHEKEKSKSQKPILKLNGRSYVFSPFSIMVLIIGGPILCLFIYFFLSLRINYWLHELTAKQIVFILNSIFNLNSQVIIYPEQSIFPTIFIPNHPFNGSFSISTQCIAGHVFSIFIGIIDCVPSSKDPFNMEDFKWRKLMVLIISISVIHILNIFRIALLLFFNFNGIPFEFIHQSLFFLTAIIGALFFTFVLHKWLPEIFISIYYIYPLISQRKRAN